MRFLKSGATVSSLVVVILLAGCSSPVPAPPSRVLVTTDNQVYVLELQLLQLMAEYQVLDETFRANNQAYTINKLSAAELYAITEKQAGQLKELNEAITWMTGEVHRLAKERDKATEDVQTLGNTWLNLVDHHDSLLGKLKAITDNTSLTVEEMREQVLLSQK